MSWLKLNKDRGADDIYASLVGFGKKYPDRMWGWVLENDPHFIVWAYEEGLLDDEPGADKLYEEAGDTVFDPMYDERCGMLWPDDLKSLYDCYDR